MSTIGRPAKGEETPVIETRETAESYVLEVHGPLDGNAQGDLQVALSRALASPARVVAMDLSETSWIGSHAIGSLLVIHSDLKLQRRTFRITACSDNVQRLMKHFRLHKLLEIDR